MGSRMPDLLLIRRMDGNLHQCWQKNIETSRNQTSQQVWKTNWLSQKHTKTKMTAMPKSIDLKPPLTHFHFKIWWIPGIGKQIGFYHSVLRRAGMCFSCRGSWVLFASGIVWMFRANMLYKKSTLQAPSWCNSENTAWIALVLGWANLDIFLIFLNLGS